MYPVTPPARDRFVLERRGSRTQHDPWHYQHLMVEDELTEASAIAQSATVFLTGKECAWRCAMCDLWQYTTTADTPAGAIPAQVAAARAALETRRPSVTQIKLYNASNFFDSHAVPESDYPAIATHLKGLDRVIVESHPALIGRRVDRFLDTLNDRASTTSIQLEVAMGLETANPDALERLNKGISLESFLDAAAALRNRGIDVRVFLLISPPFVSANEQDRWLAESVDTAFACGATAVSLIPTRSGNGAMETLAEHGLYRSPDLADIERSIELAHTRGVKGRIFVDLWDLERFSGCRHCLEARRARLHAMNLEQRSRPSIRCGQCGHGLAP